MAHVRGGAHVHLNTNTQGDVVGSDTHSASQSVSPQELEPLAFA